MKPLYKINEKYFENIDTEDKSYFLGIIFADGYLNDKRKYLSISLQETDVDILEKLTLSIETNKPLQYIIRKEVNTSNQYRLLITRKKIVEDLKKLGVHQNKSLTSKPDNITFSNDILLKHFLRGYFDGDGSLTYYKVKNTLNSSINIVCTNEFYNYFSSFISNVLLIKTTRGKRFNDNKNCYDLRICGNRNVIKFLDYIYSDSNIFLERKKHKFIQFKKIYENKINKSLGDTVTINVIDKTFYSFKEASKYFKIPLTTFKRNIKNNPNYMGYEWTITRK
jgi:hypothetical protein